MPSFIFALQSKRCQPFNFESTNPSQAQIRYIQAKLADPAHRERQDHILIRGKISRKNLPGR